MKKLNKKVLLLLVLVSFFVGINNVKAIECRYKLPFIGINKSKQYIDPSDFGCSYGETVDCSLVAKVSNNRSNFYTCVNNGGETRTYTWNNTLSKWGDGSSNTIIPIYEAASSASDSCSHVDCATNSDGLEFKINSTTCPKYIKLQGSSAEGNALWLYSLLYLGEGSCKNDCFYSINNITGLSNALVNSNGVCNTYNIAYKPHMGIVSAFQGDEPNLEFESKTYDTTDSEKKYRDYIKNFNSSSASLDGVVLPLIGPIYEEKDNANNEIIENNFKIFRELVSDNWIKELNEQKTKLKSKCGDKWYNYIDIANYKGKSVGTFTINTSENFITYMTSTGVVKKASKKEIDPDMSDECWSARSEFAKMFKSFGIFMYSMDVKTDGLANDDGNYYRSFTDADPEENAATNWTTMEWFYRTVKVGTGESVESYTSVNERVNNQATCESKYNACKNELDALKNSNASSEKISTKEATCNSIYDKCKESADSNKLVQASEADWDSNDLKIGIKTMEYEPKCKDVEFLTDMWSLMIIIAPFLMIIFGSFDYFAAIVSSDEERLKKAKSKFPKRLLAFLLFLIVPMLIKILLKTFGTHGAGKLTYLYCILSGDKSGEYLNDPDSNGINIKKADESDTKVKTGSSSSSKDNKTTSDKNKGNDNKGKSDSDNANENPVDEITNKTNELKEKAEEEKKKKDSNKSSNQEQEKKVETNDENKDDGVNKVKPNL